MVILLYQNKKLMKAIKEILEIFPEGVIIQSIDKETKNTIIEFANESVKTKILNVPHDAQIRRSNNENQFTGNIIYHFSNRKQI
jgi:predicted Co/Zn/Cd cation transporter (cation efflux family)